MHLTIAGEVTHPRPARADHRLFGPFAGAADVADRLAQADRDAIDLRGGERAEQSGHRVDHRLVDQTKALAHAAEAHQCRALARQRPRDQIRVSDQLTDPQNLVVQLDRGRRVVRDVEGLHRPQLDQPSQLRAGFAPFEQPLGASQPTQCHRETVAHGVVEDQIDGQARGAAFFVIGDAIRERALAELDACVPLADPHGCHRGTLEVIEIERRLCIGEPVRLEGGDPIAALERRPSIGQEVIAARSRLIHALILTLRGQTSKGTLSRLGSSRTLWTYSTTTRTRPRFWMRACGLRRSLCRCVRTRSAGK